MSRIASRLLSLAILLSTQGVDAKLTSCRTRFVKGVNSEYCTKFGTGSFTELNEQIKSRMLNEKSLTANNNQKHVKIELAIIADQDYD